MSEENQSLLAQRVRSRHEKALGDFMTSIREIYADHDHKATEALSGLKDYLASYSLERIALVEEGRVGLQAFKDKVEASSDKFAENPATCPLLEDDIHIAGEASMSVREARAHSKKCEVLNIARESFRIHADQMKVIQEAEDELARMEASRVASTQEKLDILGSAVAAAAHVNETELQVIVQRATHTVNRILLQNQINIKGCVASCREGEILAMRDGLANIADLYNDQLAVIQDSFVLWTVQFLSGHLFHQPEHRVRLLRSLALHNDKIKEEVRQAIKGLCALADTLTRVKPDSRTAEVCGGTEANGWLRFYDDDYHRPLYSKPPQTISSEWETFLGVILKNAQCSALEMLESFGSAEASLVRLSQDVRHAANEQLRSLFTPSKEEEAIVLQCCLSEEFRFPLNTIILRPENIEVSQEELNTMIDPILSDIKQRGEVFVSILAEAIKNNTEKLSGQLASDKDSVMSYIVSATTELENISTRSLSRLRNYWLLQEEGTKDFDDHTARLEKSYVGIVASLQRASSVSDADAQFAKGMQVLNQLEESYHSYHNATVGPMMTFDAEVKAVLAEDAGALFNTLKVSSEPTDYTIAAPDGQTYYLEGTDWCFPSQVAVAVPIAAPPTPDTLVAPKKAAKPVPPKKSKELTEAAAPAEVATSLVTEPNPIAAEFTSKISEVLTPECMLAASDIKKFRFELQTTLLKWVVMLKLRALKTLTAYNTRRRDAMNSQVNDLIRRHIRRAPSLQSGIYELRIRELQASQQNRRRQMENYENRLALLSTTINSCIEDSKDILAENVAQLNEVTRDIKEVTTNQAMETHNRSFGNLLRRMRETVEGRKLTIEGQLRSLVAAIMSDCDAYKASGTKSFDQGGSVTEAERRETLRAISEFMEKLSNAEEELSALIEANIDGEYELLNEASDSYEEAKQQCAEELAFFDSVHRVLSELKGKAYNMMLANDNANNQLDAIIANMEALVREKVTAEQEQLTFPGCLQAAKQQQTGKIPNNSSTYGGLDELLSSRLRQTHMNSSMLFHECRAQRILQTMMELRMPLFQRGALLDVLKNKIDAFRLSQDILVDPTQEAIDILLTAPAQPPAAAAAKKKAPNPKEAKVAAPVPSAPSKAIISVSAEGYIDTPNEPFTVPTTLTADMASLCNDAQQTIDDHINNYLASGEVIRSEVLGGSTCAQLHASTSVSVQQQLKRIEEYVDEGRRKYREQVQRVLIITSDTAEELFRCLQAVCAKSVSLRLQDVLSSFYDYYNMMTAHRGEHNQRLKGCLAAPSNRATLIALVADEEERQEAAQKAIKIMWAVALREIQAESSKMAMRCLVSLQSYYWLLRGIVGLEHLVPGAAAALGEHKGLRRLLRKGERNTQSTAADVTVIPDPKVAAAPSGKADKTGKKVVAKAVEQVDKAELMPLEVPMCDYDGVDPNKLKVFDQFIAQSTETAKLLVDHYLLPSQWSLNKPVKDEAPAELASKKDPKAKKGAGPAAPVAPTEPQPVCAHHRAPAEQVYQSAHYTRTRAVELLRNSMQHAANDATRHFAGLLLDERQWSHSWSDAIARL